MIGFVSHSVLEDNLCALTAALKDYQKSGKLKLYSYTDERILFYGTLFGQVLKILDKIQTISPPWRDEDPYPLVQRVIEFQFNQQIAYLYQQRAILIALQIRNLAKQIGPLRLTDLMDRFILSLPRYSNHLSLDEYSTWAYERGLRQGVNENLPDRVRDDIQAFFSAAGYFWKMVHIKGSSELTAPIDSMLNKKKFFFYDGLLYKTLFNQCMSAYLECDLEQAHPINEFAKILLDHDLDRYETTNLNKWIDGVNKRHQSIDVGQFAETLKEIAYVLFLATGIENSYAKLIHLLDRKICYLINEEDLSHLQWRDQLAPGCGIPCNNQIYILGDRLSPDSGVNDEYVVYSLKDYPDFVITIANNRFKLILKSLKQEDPQEHWGIRPASPGLSGYDEDGVCLILERLKTPFSRYNWTSQTFELNDVDRRVALILASHIVCCKHSKVSLPGLSLKDLMFDKNGVLKTTRLLKKAPDDYDHWEEFCCQVANNNEHVLRYLMRVTDLFKHKIAEFYLSAVSESLRDGRLDGEMPFGHWEEKNMAKVKELRRQGEDLRKAIFVSVSDYQIRNNTFDRTQARQIKKIIRAKLAALYAYSPTHGRFLPSLKEAIVRELISPTPSSVIDFTATLDDEFKLQKIFYRTQYKALIDFNRAVLAEQKQNEASHV